jgi:transposase
MRSYSQDLRDRVLRALERKERPTDIAARFEVSREWIYLVRNRLRDNGMRHSLQIGGHRVSRLAPFKHALHAWIKANADLTLAEIAARLKQQGVAINLPALWHQLNNWGLSYKKNAARQRARTRRRATRASGVDCESARP